MINDAIDLKAHRHALATRGRTQIAEYLQAEAADRLHECLAHEVPWTLAYRSGGESRVLPHTELAALSPADHAEMLRSLAREARGRYGFAYESYMMVTAYKEGRDPDLLLNPVLEFLNSAPYIAFVRALTGDAGIRRVSAQATCYRPGHFLKRHTDHGPDVDRRYAYVINLTEAWEADWGGQLQFLDAEGAVLETFLPYWNTLSIFRVPAEHLVTPVAAWAEQDRYAITGWLEG